MSPFVVPPLLISPWPTGGPGTPLADESGRPRTWLRPVNTPQGEAELATLRRAVGKCRPYGSDAHWTERTATRLDLTQTLRPPRRPKRSKPE